MSSVLDKILCVKLNAAWQPIKVRSVRDAFTDLTSMTPGEEQLAVLEHRAPRPAALAIDLSFGLNADGTVNYDDPLCTVPTKWEDWINLLIRDYDLTVTTSHGEVRVPTMLIASNYRDMPEKEYKPNRRTIRDRDKGICQVTRRFIGDKGNLGHIIPRDRGGKLTFENIAWMDPEVNTRMGNRTPDEAGMPLIRKPYAPKPVPLMVAIARDGAKHPSWQWVIKDLV